MTEQPSIPDTGDFNVNLRYGVSITDQSETEGRFIASGALFDRETMTLIGTDVTGEGETWPMARSRAMAAAWRIATDLSA